MLDSLKTLSSKNELWPSPFMTRKARGTQTENVFFFVSRLSMSPPKAKHIKKILYATFQTKRIRQKSGRCHLNRIGKDDGFKSKLLLNIKTCKYSKKKLSYRLIRNNIKREYFWVIYNRLLFFHSVYLCVKFIAIKLTHFFRKYIKLFPSAQSKKPRISDYITIL